MAIIEEQEERVLRPVGRRHRRHQRVGVRRDRDGARAHATSSATSTRARNGIIGALTEELIDTGKESAAAIRALRSTPAGAFGSCRYKLKSLDKNRREYERLIEVFRAHDIAWFFYNGGGDSADTCFKVSQLSESMGYPLQAIHVPKTVDNDLPITDCCPGFGSVAKYVAVSALEASFDVRSMARTSTKVFVLEVMGRHAGWIAAAGGLIEEHGIPVVILFPEIEFDEAKFIARVDALVKEHGYCTVVVSEGAHRADGTFLAEQGTRDAFGHAQLGGAAPVVAQHGQDRARPQVPLGGRRLPAARGAPHRLEDRRAPGLRARQARRRAGAEGPERGHADDRAHLATSRTATGSASPTSPTSPTSRSSCRATSSAPTASRSPRSAGATCAR